MHSVFHSTVTRLKRTNFLRQDLGQDLLSERAMRFPKEIWSGGRDSNPQSPAWKLMRTVAPHPLKIEGTTD